MVIATTTGLDDLITDLENNWEQASEIFDEMLGIAADESEKSWKAAIDKHGLVASGDMKDSVKSDMNKKAAGGLKIVTTFPRGKDKRGVRNALKAFINHHGSRRNKATYFVDDIEKDLADRLPEMLFTRWEEFQREGK